MHTETLRLLENSVVQKYVFFFSFNHRSLSLFNCLLVIHRSYHKRIVLDCSRTSNHGTLSHYACQNMKSSLASYSSFKFFSESKECKKRLISISVRPPLFILFQKIKKSLKKKNDIIDIIPRFILHIRQLYRWQNHYHNFEHAVDVLQAIHCYLRAAGVVPPVSLLLLDVDAPNGGGMWSSTRQPDSEPLVTCLTHREIFALYLAAIGHDVAHPGFNNPFMVSKK